MQTLLTLVATRTLAAEPQPAEEQPLVEVAAVRKRTELVARQPS